MITKTKSLKCKTNAYDIKISTSACYMAFIVKTYALMHI